MTAGVERAWPAWLPTTRSAERALERGGRELVDGEREDVAVGAAASGSDGNNVGSTAASQCRKRFAIGRL